MSDAILPLLDREALAKVLGAEMETLTDQGDLE